MRGLVLVEGEPPGRQPLTQPLLDLFGLLTTGAHRDEIICIPHEHGTPALRTPGVSAGRVVADPCGFLHPVQGHVEEQWADHSPLRSPGLGWGEPASIHGPGHEPLPDQTPGGEGAERGHQPVVVDAVERRRQVRVEHPHTLRVLPVERAVDGPDRVVTAAAGPKAVRLRLEPRFPLGFQCTQCHGLQAPVNNHRNPESALLRRSRFGDEHPLDGLGNPRSGTVLYPAGQSGLGLGE